MAPVLLTDPHDSCHHSNTEAGDTFGGLGTSREFREEESPRLRTLDLVYDLVQKPED